jgi:hypothetical protein
LNCVVIVCSMQTPDCFSKRHHLPHLFSDGKMYSRLFFCCFLWRYWSALLQATQKDCNMDQQYHGQETKSIIAFSCSEIFNLSYRSTTGCTSTSNAQTFEEGKWPGLNPHVLHQCWEKHLSTSAVEWVQRRVTKWQFGKRRRERHPLKGCRPMLLTTAISTAHHRRWRRRRGEGK